MRNNKGFAVTTVVYSILILLTLFMFMVLALYRNTYKNQKEFITDVKNELNDYLIEEYTPKDTNPPICTLEVIDKNSTTKTLIITSTDIDLDEEPYLFDGGTYSGINKKDITEDGTYSAYVRDLSGNVSRACSVTVVFDNEPPTITKTVTGGNGTATINFTITDSGSGLSGYAITTSTTTPTSWTSISGTSYSGSFTKTSAGTYYIHAKDVVGNKDYIAVVLSLSRNSKCSCSAYKQSCSETCVDTSCAEYDTCAKCGCASYNSNWVYGSYYNSSTGSTSQTCNAYGCYKTVCTSGKCHEDDPYSSYCCRDATRYCGAYKSCSSCSCLRYNQSCTTTCRDTSTCETYSACWLS